MRLKTSGACLLLAFISPPLPAHAAWQGASQAPEKHDLQCRGNSQAILKRAAKLHRQGHYPEVLSCLKFWNRFQGRERLRALRLRGEAYQYLGELELAWLNLQYGLLLDPHNVSLHEGLGWLAIFQKDYREAQLRLRQASALAPENLWVQLNLGLSYYLDQQHEKAFAIWEPHLQSALAGRTFAERLEADFQLLSARSWPEEQFKQGRDWLKRF